MGKHAGVFLTAGFPVLVPAPRRRSLPSPCAVPGGWCTPGNEELDKSRVQRGVCKPPAMQAAFPTDSPWCSPPARDWEGVGA